MNLFRGACIGALISVVLNGHAWAQTPDLDLQFQKELQQAPKVTTQDFRAQFSVTGLDQISWDPATAKSWAELHQGPPSKKVTPEVARDLDFRPSPEETEILRRQGFVVSERLGRDSMTGLLYRIYSADLPLFLSADCILHAWHLSFNEAFARLEIQLSQNFAESLEAMLGQIASAERVYGSGELAQSIKDVDLLLTVAVSLLRSSPVDSPLGQNRERDRILSFCASERDLPLVELFGRKRRLDFSRLKIRGRYERFEALQPYFRASTFCQLVSLRLSDDANWLHEFRMAMVLSDLLRRSGKAEVWTRYEDSLTRLVGPTDGLSLGQSLRFLGSRTPTQAQSLATEFLQTRLGVEQIPSFQMFMPDTAASPARPRVFFLSGARLTFDSWALSQTVFRQIESEGVRVQRRIPSGLDIAFSVLRNDYVVEELAQRFEGPGMPFRDGLPYQPNLVGVRRTLDRLPEKAWSGSVAAHWLACLRHLSGPGDSRTPESMRTKAWGLRSANAQMASWAQLRHNVILDAKQPETGGTLCSYPFGYVEPKPMFWNELEQMAYSMESIARDLSSEDLTHFYKRFARTMSVLKAISEKQLAQEPLDEKELQFLQETVEKKAAGSGGMHFTGWYFQLFYRGDGRDEPELWEPTVADVHTSPEDPVSGCPRTILLEGTGAADLLIVAVDSGPDRMVYLGPSLSYYEWTSPERMSNSEWMMRVESGLAPRRPEWTASYLVPYSW